jgi:TRAP-type C4-dicarboxylate transport system permease small subunit
LISYGGLLGIMLLNVVDVLMTKAFTAPISGAYEITEVLLLCTVMAAFAYTQSQRTHINMTIFVKHFPRAVKFSVYGLMGLLGAATAAAVGYAAILQTQSALEKGAETAVLGIPMYPFYIVEAIAMFVFALALLYDTVLAFGAIRSDKYQEIVTSDWA